MSNLIEFPGADRPVTESEIDSLSEAFRDLEGDVCDLERMGHIAQDLIMDCAAREDHFRQLELATFAVWQLAKMAREFRDNYYKRHHGEMRGVS
jgi:hypothetical protein